MLPNQVVNETIRCFLDYFVFFRYKIVTLRKIEFHSLI